MRDQRFIAQHRGGLLTKENHRGLIRWARECSEHILPLLEGDMDPRLLHALKVAEDWEMDRVPTGNAMKASVGSHAAARVYTSPVSTAVARSIGHAVATAHMADHSLGAPLYALKAVKLAGKSVEEERAWQNERLQHLPPEIVQLVGSTMKENERGFMK